MFKYFEAIEELPKELKTPMVKVLELFREDIAETVKRSDFERFERATEENFNRVWRAIEALTEAQKKTEQRIEELTEAQKTSESRLTRLERVVEELAEAQKRTEEEVRRLAIKVNELSIGQENLCIGQENLRIGQDNLRKEVGGLTRSFGYAFENEAYRMIPKTLKEKYGIELTERLIRTDIDDTEINILGLGVRDGKEVVVVGEAKARLEREEVFDELDEKVQIVKNKYSGREVVRVLVTHFAPKGMMRMAKEREVIVIQSFEWEM